MKERWERANVCAWMAAALAVQQNRPSLVVVSDGPSSPLRALGKVVCPHGTGWALELAGRSKPGGPLVGTSWARGKKSSSAGPSDFILH